MIFFPGSRQQRIVCDVDSRFASTRLNRQGCFRGKLSRKESGLSAFIEPNRTLIVRRIVNREGVMVEHGLLGAKEREKSESDSSLT